MIDRIRQRCVDALGIWRQPLLYGATTAIVFWCVWYFTKVPCTPHNADMGLCNPGWLAQLVNAEILALAVGAGIAVGSVKGGYDIYMLKNMINQEREARLKAEQQLANEQQTLRELIADLREELREERQRRDEEQLRRDEERQEDRQRYAEQHDQTLAIQQAMLDTIVRLAERRNGNGNHGSD